MPFEGTRLGFKGSSSLFYFFALAKILLNVIGRGYEEYSNEVKSYIRKKVDDPCIGVTFGRNYNLALLVLSCRNRLLHKKALNACFVVTKQKLFFVTIENHTNKNKLLAIV